MDGPIGLLEPTALAVTPVRNIALVKPLRAIRAGRWLPLVRALVKVLPRRLRRRLFKDIWREHAMCLLLDRHRLRLHVADPEDLFPGFDALPIKVEAIPRGNWSSPLVDAVYLQKIVGLLRPLRILELGSYKGYTALAMARQFSADQRLITVDVLPDHGSAYAGRPEAQQIERRVGAVNPALFRGDAPGSYDLIFIDADHRYEAARHDTQTVLPLLAPAGLMVWHDYANWGLFTGGCGVPEFLHEFAETRPVLHLAGSNLAVHSPAWTTSSFAWNAVRRTQTRAGALSRG